MHRPGKKASPACCSSCCWLCLPAFGEGAKEVTSTEVNILMTPQEEWCQGMKQEFEAKYNITVNYVRMSSGEGLARIRAEKDNPQFDLWWGGPIDSFVAAKQEGLLEAYDSPSYKNLLDPKKYKDAENYWVGIYVGTLGFCTNKDWLAAHPKFQGPGLLGRPVEAGVQRADPGGPPVHLGHFLHGPGHGAADPRRGQGLAVPQVLCGPGAPVHQERRRSRQVRGAGRGRRGGGVLARHRERDRQQQAAPGVELPKEGTGYEIGGMAILKGGKHRDAAQLWFDWAITADAQALGPKYKAYQAPTVKGVKLSHPELLQVNPIKYDFQWAGKNKKAFVDKFTNELAGTANLK